MADQPQMKKIDIERYRKSRRASSLGVPAALFIIGVLLFFVFGAVEKIGWVVSILVPAIVAGGLAIVFVVAPLFRYRGATMEIGWDGDFVYYRGGSGLHSIDLRRVKRVEINEMEAGGIEFHLKDGREITLFPGLGYEGPLGRRLFDGIQAWCERSGIVHSVRRKEISKIPRGIFYECIIGEARRVQEAGPERQ